MPHLRPSKLIHRSSCEFATNNDQYFEFSRGRGLRNYSHANASSSLAGQGSGQDGGNGIENTYPENGILNRADLDKAGEQRDLTSPFIEQFLTLGEKRTIRNDSPRLIEKMKCQQLK